MMKPVNYLIFLILMTGLVAAGPALGDGIKERMLNRGPAIVDLKDKGIIGETNRGYLAFVTGTRVSEALVADENQDRKTIYLEIAKAQKVSLELVEKRRAIQLAERAKPGHFIQNEAGAWVKR